MAKIEKLRIAIQVHQLGMWKQLAESTIEGLKVAASRK